MKLEKSNTHLHVKKSSNCVIIHKIQIREYINQGLGIAEVIEDTIYKFLNKLVPVKERYNNTIFCL
ncbi:hypothetical protein OCHUTO_0068 [Orientia chuto str. Dubai]|uniref:Uncharacterized protein n=1 Tax=Orientia chuto str. Dubai TaxID=1359168 RepID=A0A0F3MNX6_9RICK|nr:hypothetical protein [Candidatus Orientia mediorientalis]KJV57483.1 hypothetical protein OCHUTO_0068 [Orientia chuto str. Dubai]